MLIKGVNFASDLEGKYEAFQKAAEKGKTLSDMEALQQENEQLGQ